MQPTLHRLAIVLNARGSEGDHGRENWAKLEGVKEDIEERRERRLSRTGGVGTRGHLAAYKDC